MNNDKADFTQGSILKKLIAFMIPVLGALILQAAYGAVDLLVVGRFGSTSGLSAVSTGSQVLNLVTFVVIQFAMGITVLIARYLGEKKPQQIGAVVGGASIVFTIISAVLFVVMVFFARPIAILMQAPEAAVDQNSYDYLKGFALESIVTAVLFSMIGYFNGNNQTLWVMTQGLIQTLLVRLPLAYFMSIQPDASLTKIGLAAPVSTIVGIVLNIGYYIYWTRKQQHPPVEEII